MVSVGQESGCCLDGSYGSKSQGRDQDQLRPQSSQDSTRGGFTSKLTWLLEAFSSLRTVRLRVSVPHWLLAGVLPQFLATWASIRQLKTWQTIPSEKAGEKARRIGKTKSQSYLWPNLGSDSQSSVTFYLRHITRSSPHSCTLM